MPQRQGSVAAIFIAPVRREPMVRVEHVQALAGLGLEGDRYAQGEGSYNRPSKKRPSGLGLRQVTLIHECFFDGSVFTFGDSRRNIVVRTDPESRTALELYDLIHGQEFQIGEEVIMRGIKYCDPCDVPSGFAEKGRSFQRDFRHRGGIVAAVIRGGLVRENDLILGPQKDY